MLQLCEREKKATSEDEIESGKWTEITNGSYQKKQAKGGIHEGKGADRWKRLGRKEIWATLERKGKLEREKEKKKEIERERCGMQNKEEEQSLFALVSEQKASFSEREKKTIEMEKAFLQVACIMHKNVGAHITALYCLFSGACCSYLSKYRCRNTTLLLCISARQSFPITSLYFKLHLEHAVKRCVVSALDCHVCLYYMCLKSVREIPRK